MSIAFADPAPTATTQAAAMPVTPATQPDEQATPLLLAISVLWLIVATVVARRTGVFRRRSIVGPERLSPRDSAWVLVGTVIIAYFLASGIGGWVYARLHVNDDAKPLVLTAIVYAVLIPVTLAGLASMLRGGLRSIGLSARRAFAGVAIGLLTLFLVYPVVSVVSDVTGMVITWLQLPKPEAHAILQSLSKWHDPRMLALA